MDKAWPGHGGVTIPGRVQKTCGCGTGECGLMVNVEVLLDLMILEVFPTLRVLWFSDSIYVLSDLS